MGKTTYIFSRDLSLTPLGNDDDSPVLIKILHNDPKKVRLSLKNRLNTHYPNLFNIKNRDDHYIISLKNNQSLPGNKSITRLIMDLDNNRYSRIHPTFEDFELIENNFPPSITLQVKSSQVSVQAFYQYLFTTNQRQIPCLLKIQCNAKNGNIVVSFRENEHLPLGTSLKQALENIMPFKLRKIPLSAFLGNINDSFFSGKKRAPFNDFAPPTVIPEAHPSPFSEETPMIDAGDNYYREMEIDNDDVAMTEEDKETLAFVYALNRLETFEERIDKQEEILSRIEKQALSLYSYFNERKQQDQNHEPITNYPGFSHPDEEVSYYPLPAVATQSTQMTQHAFFYSPTDTTDEPCTLKQLETLFFGQHLK